MRLDHIAYRVRDRKATTRFFIDALGYRVQEEFQLEFGDGTTADCIALEPEDRRDHRVPFTQSVFFPTEQLGSGGVAGVHAQYHIAPEIFVSDGVLGSIVGEWVAARGGIGGIHHVAYQVDSVQKTMDEWREKGYAEFATEAPLTCPGLVQVFTKPSELTGVIYEFIERGEHGFCRENVKALMESTKGL